MALLKYDTSSRAWKEVESLVKYDTSANAWTDCEVALKHDGTAWTEVWNAVPDGYLIYKGKIISDELTQWSIEKDVEGTITNFSYVNMIGQSELNTASWTYHRFTERIKTDLVTIPSGATKFCFEYEFSHNSPYTMNYCYISPFVKGKTGSSSKPSINLGTGILEYDITSSIFTNYGVCGLQLSFFVFNTTDENVPQFNVDFKIKNMWFE